MRCTHPAYGLSLLALTWPFTLLSLGNEDCDSVKLNWRLQWLHFFFFKYIVDALTNPQ